MPDQDPKSLPQNLSQLIQSLEQAVSVADFMSEAVEVDITSESFSSEDFEKLFLFPSHLKAFFHEYRQSFYLSTAFTEQMLAFTQTYIHDEKRHGALCWMLIDWISYVRFYPNAAEVIADKLYQTDGLMGYSPLTHALLERAQPSDQCIKTQFYPRQYREAFCYRALGVRMRFMTNEIARFWIYQRPELEASVVLSTLLEYSEVEPLVIDTLFKRATDQNLTRILYLLLTSPSVPSLTLVHDFFKQAIFLNQLNWIEFLLRDPKAGIYRQTDLFNALAAVAFEYGQQAAFDLLLPHTSQWPAHQLRPRQLFQRCVQRLSDSKNSHAQFVQHLILSKQDKQTTIKLPQERSDRHSTLIAFIRMMLFAAQAQMQPDTITRLITPEFFFYPRDRPFTLEEYSRLVSSLEQMAAEFKEGVHAMLSSFPLRPDAHSKRLINLVVYLQCGDRPTVNVFSKGNPHRGDWQYSIEQDDIYEPSHQAQASSRQGIAFYSPDKNAAFATLSYLSVFNLNEGVMFGADICADVFEARAKRLAMRQAHSNNMQRLEPRVDYVTSETYVKAKTKQDMACYFHQASLTTSFFRACQDSALRSYNLDVHPLVTLNYPESARDLSKAQLETYINQTQEYSPEQDIQKQFSADKGVLLCPKLGFFRIKVTAKTPIPILETLMHEQENTLDVKAHNQHALFRQAAACFEANRPQTRIPEAVFTSQVEYVD